MPAPSAVRMAISRMRLLPRESSKFATLPQAISKTRVTAPNNRNSVGREPSVRSACNPEISTPKFLLVLGCSAARRRKIVSVRTTAWRSVTPGRRRATKPNGWRTGLVSSSPIKGPGGSQISVPFGN